MKPNELCSLTHQTIYERRCVQGVLANQINDEKGCLHMFGHIIFRQESSNKKNKLDYSVMKSNMDGLFYSGLKTFMNLCLRFKEEAV